MFLSAAAVILLCAEHFAEALVASGESLGVSEILLVQWLAPLASETPDLLVACLYAYHDEVRILTGVAYLVMAAVYVLRSRRQVPVLRDGFRTSYAVMSAGS